MKKTDKAILLQKRIQRFIACNSRMREATLKSEQAFLTQAGNISPAQLEILLAVGEHTPCTMSHLAHVLHISQANVTQMVDKLVYKKFLTRVKSNTDRRIVHLKLLAKGAKVSDLHREHVERVAYQWFSVMTDKEQEAMLAAWERVLHVGFDERNKDT
jgi:DNA-binding MarR family transcriptional regulator